MKFNTKESLAEFIIKSYIAGGKTPEISETEIDSGLLGQGACFVTVYIDGKLRGCIGTPIAYEPLWQNIIHNAVDAVSSDFRFESIKKEELDRLTVEISVLTQLEPYKPGSTEELLEKLKAENPGLTLELHGRKALFLPQVWDDLPEPADFLSHLCLKAGLPPDAWRNKDMKFQIFSVIK